MAVPPVPPYTVSLSADGSYVHYCSQTSSRTGADMAERLRAATILGAGHQVTRIMFDARGAGTAFQTPIAAQYEYAYHQARELGLTRMWRIAMLVPLGDRSYDFLETALINAGYVAQLFNDERQAVEWLKGESDSTPAPVRPPY
jgi:hypothetical protein